MSGAPLLKVLPEGFLLGFARGLWLGDFGWEVWGLGLIELS